MEITLKRTILTLVAMIVIGLVSFSSQSSAGFRVCNKSDQSANVAVGYKSNDYGWVSEGWWVIDAGNCEQIITGDLNSRYYYIYAEGTGDEVWQAKKGQDGGFFCISSSKFTLRNEDFQKGTNIDCEASGQKTKHFTEVDTGSYEGFTFNLKP